MQRQPRHLTFITPPFVIAVTTVLMLRGDPIMVGQVPIILIGMELWDLGWHSSAHHRDLWLAHPLVRVAGTIIAIVGCLL